MEFVDNNTAAKRGRSCDLDQFTWGITTKAGIRQGLAFLDDRRGVFCRSNQQNGQWSGFHAAELDNWHAPSTLDSKNQVQIKKITAKFFCQVILFLGSLVNHTHEVGYNLTNETTTLHQLADCPASGRLSEANPNA